MPTNEEQLKKTLALAAMAVIAFGVMILASQFVMQRNFWREVDEWRTESKHGEFLRWLRERDENPESESETD